MQSNSLSVAVSMVGISATLCGVFLGHRVARLSDDRLWLVEQATNEYRELLDALTSVFLELMWLTENVEPLRIPFLVQGFSGSDVELQSFRVLRNRLFIAERVSAENLSIRWTEALEMFKKSGDGTKFTARFESISASIVWLSTGKGAPHLAFEMWVYAAAQLSIETRAVECQHDSRSDPLPEFRRFPPSHFQLLPEAGGRPRSESVTTEGAPHLAFEMRVSIASQLSIET